MILLLLCLTYFSPYDTPEVHPCGGVRAQLQLCLTLCDSMDCIARQAPLSMISQARILERVAMRSSRGSP